MDQAFWFEQYGGAVSIVVLEPALSLGQAHTLKSLLLAEGNRVQGEEDLLRVVRVKALQAGISERVLHDIVSRRAHYGDYWAGRAGKVSDEMSGEAKRAGNRELSQESAWKRAGSRELSQEMSREGSSEERQEESKRAMSRELSNELTRESDWKRGGANRAAPELQLDLLERMETELQGRSLTRDEFAGLLEHADLAPVGEHWASYLQAAYLRGTVELVTGLERIERERRWWNPARWKRGVLLRCRRCGSGMSRMYATECPHCGGLCSYCEACLTMGRQRQCSLLVRGLAPQRCRAAQRPGAALAAGQSKGLQTAAAANSDRQPAPATAVHGAALPVPAREPAPAPRPLGGPPPLAGGDPLGKWGLSPAQRAAVVAALAFLASPQPHPTADAPPRSFLIWAVTGAGKTEMIYPIIEAELARGGTVLIATPRRDVVLELRPRVQRAFPDRTLVTLYGGSEDRWKRGDITLATTHQLMRFGRAFDLIIIDELDAFPYHNNSELQFAASQVCKPQGTYIFLSATPPAPMQRAVSRNQLPNVRVPVRFHRHPLPVPRLLHATRRNPLPNPLKQALAASLARGAQLFVFVSRIREVDIIVSRLQALYAQLRIAGTSSTDPDRTDKVNDFRKGRIRILVTTTILERGVTVPKTDVFILQADSTLFDEASLVQMAGRAGRSKDDPNGFVYFVSAAKTNAQAGAIRQIRQMNRMARKKGFLIMQGKGGTLAEPEQPQPNSK